MLQRQKNQMIVSKTHDFGQGPPAVADVDAAKLAQPDDRARRFHGGAGDANDVALAWQLISSTVCRAE